MSENENPYWWVSWSWINHFFRGKNCYTPLYLCCCKLTKKRLAAKIVLLIGNHYVPQETIYIIHQTYLFKSCWELAWLGYVLQLSLNSSTECQKYCLNNSRRLKRTNTNFGTREIRWKPKHQVSFHILCRY